MRGNTDMYMSLEKKKKRGGRRARSKGVVQVHPRVRQREEGSVDRWTEEVCMKKTPTNGFHFYSATERGWWPFVLNLGQKVWQDGDSMGIGSGKPWDKNGALSKLNLRGGTTGKKGNAWLNPKRNKQKKTKLSISRDSKAVC